MSYTVSMSNPVRGYLSTLSGLSRQGHLKLVTGILNLLRHHGDTLRSDPSRRMATGSSRFRFDHVFSDGGRFWRVECVADDSAAAYGVLSLVYLDCQPGT